jgi:hypothetical protein
MHATKSGNQKLRRALSSEKNGSSILKPPDETLVAAGAPAHIVGNSSGGQIFIGLNFNKYIC